MLNGRVGVTGPGQAAVRMSRWPGSATARPGDPPAWSASRAAVRLSPRRGRPICWPEAHVASASVTPTVTVANAGPRPRSHVSVVVGNSESVHVRRCVTVTATAAAAAANAITASAAAAAAAAAAASSPPRHRSRHRLRRSSRYFENVQDKVLIDNLTGTTASRSVR